jgi:hypothetical protein
MAQDRLSKLQAEKVVTLGMGYSHDLGAKIFGTLGYGRGGGKRGAGDFEGNLRRWPKSTVDRHQGAPGGNVQGSGKLEEILPRLVPATNENGDCKRQPNPLAAFCFRLAMIQDPRPLFSGEWAVGRI